MNEHFIKTGQRLLRVQNETLRSPVKISTKISLKQKLRLYVVSIFTSLNSSTCMLHATNLTGFHLFIHTCSFIGHFGVQIWGSESFSCTGIKPVMFSSAELSLHHLNHSCSPYRPKPRISTMFENNKNKKKSSAFNMSHRVDTYIGVRY